MRKLHYNYRSESVTCGSLLRSSRGTAITKGEHRRERKEALDRKDFKAITNLYCNNGGNEYAPCGSYATWKRVTDKQSGIYR